MCVQTAILDANPYLADSSPRKRNSSHQQPSRLKLPGKEVALSGDGLGWGGQHVVASREERVPEEDPAGGEDFGHDARLKRGKCGGDEEDDPRQAEETHHQWEEAPATQRLHAEGDDAPEQHAAADEDEAGVLARVDERGGWIRIDNAHGGASHADEPQHEADAYQHEPEHPQPAFAAPEEHVQTEHADDEADNAAWDGRAGEAMWVGE